jgi:hypothetical protein
MKTAMILMAQYDGLAIVPVDLVCRDYFRHLTVDKFMRKVLAGEIRIPVVRIENSSQKAAKGVHITRPRRYLDKQADAARKECDSSRLAGVVQDVVQWDRLNPQCHCSTEITVLLQSVPSIMGAMENR